MKKKIFKGILFFLIGFLLFFAFRMIYGYYRYDADGTDNYYYQRQSEFSMSVESGGEGYIRKNIASTEYKSKESYSDIAKQQVTTDQKYEKIGTLMAKSKEYESNEQKVRNLIKRFNAMVQYERKSGLTGFRSLNLVIGVPPACFDSMINEMRKLGSLNSIQIDKVDKTSEYKELEAKRISLEKTIASLSALKAKSGKIDEYVNLEQQILQYEQQLQELGVQLGDYDAENEFCTIKYYLSEETKNTHTISFFQRAFVALQWTIKYYLVFVVIFAFAALASFLLIKIAQAFKWIRKPTEENK